MNGVHTATWRRLDQPGHEAARLVHHAPFWQLGGTAVFLLDRSCRLEYQIVCDAAWRTLHARVTGWYGADPVKAELYTDTARRWTINGQPCFAHVQAMSLHPPINSAYLTSRLFYSC